MRPRTSYGTVSSLFWDGDVGCRLQAAGWEPLILSLYLTSNKHANMLGLYVLPLDQVGRELKIIPPPALLPAFDVLARLLVAFYDHENQVVWVREMAGQRVNPVAVEAERTLDASSKDRRWIAVQREYWEVRANLFTGAFFDHYHGRLQLSGRRPGTPEDWSMPRGILRGIASPLATTNNTSDQRADPTNDHVPDNQKIRRVETVDAVENVGPIAPSETSDHSSHALSTLPPPAASEFAPPEKQSDENREPLLPFARMYLVPDPVLQEMAVDQELAIADLVLNMRLLQSWHSRDELTDAVHELCAKTHGLTRVRRSLVDAGVDRAFRMAHERGLTFAAAPGARLDNVDEKPRRGVRQWEG